MDRPNNHPYESVHQIDITWLKQYNRREIFECMLILKVNGFTEKSQK